MSFRDALNRANASRFKRLGAPVKYHHVGGIVSEIQAIESVSSGYTPDGFMSSVQENETIYYVSTADIPNPVEGDFIIDGSKRFDVVSPEPVDRFKWSLIVKEAV